MTATFSVPDRRPNSWPPPWTIGCNARPSRTYSTPTPWTIKLVCRGESRSTPSSRGRTSSQAAACTPRCERSSHGRAPPQQARQSVESHRSRYWRTSRLPARVVTQGLRERCWVNQAAFVDRQEGDLEAFVAQGVERMQHRGCSICVEMMCAPRLRCARAVPRIAWLSASEPLPTNVISLRPTPSAAATRSRARSKPARARRPSACNELGL